MAWSWSFSIVRCLRLHSYAHLFPHLLLLPLLPQKILLAVTTPIPTPRTSPLLPPHSHPFHAIASPAAAAVAVAVLQAHS